MTCDDLNKAMTAAKRISKSLAAKYESAFKEVRPYLVFSSRLGQVEIDASLEKQTSDFPEMFTEETRKAKFKGDIVYLDNVCIELRFTSLAYELIWLLQKDPLVDRALTPQTHASIRIVIGTVINLSKAS
ncbi:MAG: hypothetical protein COV45_05140 [Deltaproteobacteria bacterium CG11_big_fil_rev_8_21_14_0_20_47_16]|nr:MAG: hypothetical protein COV45_05140 [Deltaproteobacteria bacterium CG11_big_fil_rev_8_21_14_0_20_47_16]